jgi:hypothetical protein
MRLIDEVNNHALKQVTLFLTIEEASSLVKQVADLLVKPKLHHVHIEDDEFKREITVAIYTSSNMSQFDERSRKIIEKDE